MLTRARLSRNPDIMVLPKTAMHTGADNPKLRAVMLKNVAGLHYIYLTTEKPPANTDNLSALALKGKYDIYFPDGFCCYCSHDMLFSFSHKLSLRIYWIVLKTEKKDVIDTSSISLSE